MTLVNGTVQDLGYDGMEGTLWARPARFRSDGQVVLAPERKPFKITGGVVSAELAPGPAVLELQVGSHARGTFEVVIPDTAITLADLLDTVFPWEPEQVSQFVAERELAVQAKTAAETAAGQASTAAGTATTAAQQTGQDRTAVATDKDTVVGHVQALAAPNDAAVLGLISEGATTQTKAALDATYGTGALADPDSGYRQVADGVFATVQKWDEGGAILRPVRTPTLAIGRTFPNVNAPFRILWASADGTTLYAVGADRTLRKSTNGGQSWTVRGNHANGFGGSFVFVRTAAGTLLTFRDAFPLSNTLMRSTDDGATWTEVYSDPARMEWDIRPMHATSMCQDPTTGHIYWGEYQGNNTAPTVRMFRSTDDGATWTVFHEFAGPTSSDPLKVRHIHAIEYDHVMQRIVVMVGDDDPKAGIYRINAAGTALEPILTNDMRPEFPSQRWARSICYIPFPDYICWGGDTMSSPYIMRMHRSEIGKPNPVVERVYRANSTMWFASRASTDGSRWIMTASQEDPAGRLDSASHIYSIQDQGATVTEVGVVSINSGALIAPYPIGGSNPADGGDTFYLGVQEDAATFSAWRCELTRGAGQMLPQANPRPAVAGLQTFSSGNVTIPANSEIIFGATASAHSRNHFRLFEVALRALPTQSAALKFELRSGGGSVLWTNTATPTSHRNFLKESSSPFLLQLLMSAGAEYLFVLKNTGSSAITAVGHVTFGFGDDLAP